MSNQIENTENSQNTSSSRFLRNVQRLALNNVTNTTLQKNNANNPSLTNFKSTLTSAKKEGSRIPQFARDAVPRSTAASEDKSILTDNSISQLSKSNLSDDKENQDPSSKNFSTLSSINEGRTELSVNRNVQESSSAEKIIQHNPLRNIGTNTDVVNKPVEIEKLHRARSQLEVSNNETENDSGKKRPISTIVEQDLPKKFKVCDENGKEEYEWEDLDAEDVNDPFMVSEYVNDIFEYLHQLEVITLPKKEDLYQHRNIHQNRDILVNWLVKIHNKFGLLPETLYLAINIMDRFLCKELVQLDKLQLVGTSCLFIASKYEEVYSPSIKHFASETDGACTEEEIKEGEKFILKTLKFNLNYPNPMNFLRRISKADDYDIQSRTLAKFLLEISLVDFRFIGILPSLCAAAAMFMSRKMLGKGKWDGNLIHYSGGYTKEELAPVCHMIMDYLVSSIVHDEFHRKYQSRRFMKASIISVQWALKVRKNGYDIMTLHE
ncbi:clb2p [Saccharomyces arboricola H-6]|uniref:Clb2p n=1 Tax=Saccharomyces arboricola (strain H-6 / AS 2.3317 / CBS 10644) TaxID=1160507 RepID=J8PXV1_SACAR|nr:clb2p [Saccharomyces arboricola H-6]